MDLNALLALAQNQQGGSIAPQPQLNQGNTNVLAQLLQNTQQQIQPPLPSQSAVGIAPPLNTMNNTGAPLAPASQTTQLLTALLQQQQEEDRKKQALIQQLNSALASQNQPQAAAAQQQQQQLGMLLQQKQLNNPQPVAAAVNLPQVSGVNPAQQVYGGPSQQLDAIAIAKLLQQQQQPQHPTAPQAPQIPQNLAQAASAIQPPQVPPTAPPQVTVAPAQQPPAAPAQASVPQVAAQAQAQPNPALSSGPSDTAAAMEAQLAASDAAATALLDNAAALSLPGDRRRKGRTGTFPQKLHQMLSDLERQDGGTDIASFLPHGRAFAIHKPRDFVKHVMPKYFRMSRFSSFQRQLNLYDFQRITEGPDKGSYYHELFVQGRPILSTMMKRNKIKGVKNLKAQQQKEAEKELKEVAAEQEDGDEGEEEKSVDNKKPPEGEDEDENLEDDDADA